MIYIRFARDAILLIIKSNFQVRERRERTSDATAVKTTRERGATGPIGDKRFEKAEI